MRKPLNPRTSTLVLMLVGCALSLARPVPAQERTDPTYNLAAAAMGKTSYRTYCMACHGPDGKGDGPIADDLKVRPSDLTRLSERNQGTFPFDRVSAIIDGRRPVRGHGTADMPAWGEAFKTTDTEEEATKRIEQLTHFVWSIQVDAPR